MASEVKCELKVDENDERKGVFMLSFSCDGMLDRGILVKASASGSEIDIPLTSAEAVGLAKMVSDQYSSYLEHMMENDERKVTDLKEDIMKLSESSEDKDKTDESD